MLYPENSHVKNAISLLKEKAFLPKRQHKSLVMLSGGLDSVALLVSLLAHTTDDVHAHHIEIRNVEGRADVENQTLARVLPYIREHYRPFTYSSSKYELMMGLGGGLDMTLSMFMAARVTCAEGSFMDAVFTGHMRASTEEFMEASAVFTACFTRNNYKPVWLFPLSRCTKFDVYNALPPELADLTWSCRTPVFDGTNYAPCHNCHACKTRAELKQEVEKFKKT